MEGRRKNIELLNHTAIILEMLCITIAAFSIKIGVGQLYYVYGDIEYESIVFNNVEGSLSD